jgi:hypothetical protein
MSRALRDVLADALVTASIACGLASPLLFLGMARAQAVPGAGGAMALAAVANADLLAGFVLPSPAGTTPVADNGWPKDPAGGVPQ